MKQINIIAVLCLLLLISCQSDVKESPEYKKILAERDSLAGLVSTDVAQINQFIADMNEIQENLNKIKEAENIININTSNTENAQSAKDRIKEDMQMIYDLMQKNKKQIQELKNKLKKSNSRITELEKMISFLEQQISSKDAEIQELKNKLEQMNIQINVLTQNIDSLNKENAIKQDIIAQKTEELNTAYYVIGTKKELKENNIITKEGGFVGIGKIEKLRDDFNKEYFTKIDITQINEIPINSKNAKILTTHPFNSYKLEKNNNTITKLVIVDKKQFWSVSKYLVILVE
jgi:chromosome segregation ATPase